jgi:hypothetical protein
VIAPLYEQHRMEFSGCTYTEDHTP